MDFLKDIWARINDEPVLVVTLVNALIAVFLAYGHPLTKDQETAIQLLVMAILGIVLRGRVTPTG